MNYKLKKSILLSDLCRELDLEMLGEDTSIESVGSLGSVRKGTFTFAKDMSDVDVHEGIICTQVEDYTVANSGVNLVPTATPRMTFIKSLIWLEKNIGFDQYAEDSDISSTAIISSGVVIESGCKIGHNVIIEPNVTIHKGTIIGDESIIRSNASIGSSGFGFERDGDGFPVRFPHLGRVVIGNNVEIGSCATIAKGTLGDTVIENNVKIDNLVHIAHNALIKSGAFVIAGAEISGGVVVGENSWIAPNACTHQKISIGKNSIIGLGAVVTKNVEENVIVAGNPAKKLRNI